MAQIQVFWVIEIQIVICRLQLKVFITSKHLGCFLRLKTAVSGSLSYKLSYKFWIHVKYSLFFAKTHHRSGPSHHSIVIFAASDYMSVFTKPVWNCMIEMLRNISRKSTPHWSIQIRLHHSTVHRLPCNAWKWYIHFLCIVSMLLHWGKKEVNLIKNCIRVSDKNK